MIKWTYEICKNEALKYKSHKEFKEKNYRCYHALTSKGWKELIAHFDLQYSRSLRGIYVFEFPDHSVYVGLTCHFNERKEEHLNGNKITAVKKHMLETGLIPEFRIVHDPVDIDSAKLFEGEFVEKYRNDGWVILNRCKTGGLGSYLKVNYDFDESVTIASQCKSRHEFAEKHCNLYSFFRDNGVLEELFVKAGLPNMRRKPSKWNKESIIKDAISFPTYFEWIKARRHTSYNAGRKMGILEEIKELYDKKV